MPRHTITDEQGRSVDLEWKDGEPPPNEQELEQVFAAKYPNSQSSPSQGSDYDNFKQKYIADQTKSPLSKAYDAAKNVAKGVYNIGEGAVTAPYHIAKGLYETAKNSDGIADFERNNLQSSVEAVARPAYDMVNQARKNIDEIPETIAKDPKSALSLLTSSPNIVNTPTGLAMLLAKRKIMNLLDSSKPDEKDIASAYNKELTDKAYEDQKSGSIAPEIIGKPNQTLAQGLSDIPNTLLLGGLLKAGLTSGAVANLPGKALRYGTDPEAIELAKKAEDLGIKIPAGTATQAPFMKGAEQTLSKLPFSSGMMARAGKEAQAGLESAQQGFLDKLSPSEGEVGTGERLQSTLDSSEKTFQADASDAYDKALRILNPKYGGAGVKVEPELARDVSGKLLSQEGSGLSSLQNKKLSSVLDELSDPSRAYNYNSASKVSSQLGDLIQQYNNVGEAQAARSATIAKNAIDEDIRNSIIDSGKPDAIDAFNDADKFYKEGRQFFDKVQSKKLLSTDPEKVADIITKPNSATFIDQLKRNLTPDQFQPVKRSFAERVIEKGFDKINPDTLKAVFSPEEADALNTLQQIKNRLKDVSTETKPSDLTSIAGTGQGAAIIASPIAGIVATATPPMLAKWALSPMGRKYLMEGMQVNPMSPQAKVIAQGLAAIAVGKEAAKDPSEVSDTERQISLKQALIRLKQAVSK